MVDTRAGTQTVYPVRSQDQSWAVGLQKRLHLSRPRSRSFGLRNVEVSTRLTLLVLVGAVPLLILNLAMIYDHFRNERGSTLHQALVLSRAIAQSTQGFLDTSIADLLSLGESRRLAAGDLVGFRAAAERVLRHQFAGDAIVLSRQNGQRLIDTRFRAGVPLPDGEQRERPAQTVAKGLPAVSGVFVPDGATRPVIAIDVPVGTATGPHDLILSLYIGLDAFARLIEREKPTDGWIVAIIDQNGLRVARSPAADLVGQPVTQGGTDPWPTRPEATFDGISPQGTPVLAAYSGLPHIGWRASVAVPSKLLIAPAWRSALLSVAAASIFLLFGILLQRKISHGITGPLATLHRIAVAPDSDRFDADVTATGMREADEVAQALIAEKRSRHEARASLQRALEQRTVALAQRDLLLREVYHRVKNNLQLVDGLLALQISQTANGEVVEELSDLRGRVYALGLVHQQLMMSTDLKSFDIRPFLHQLADNVMAAGGRRNCAVHVEAANMMVTLDFATPLGLLVNELITNCLKHSFPRGGATISISLDRNDRGDVVLTVASDRSGEPQAEAPRTATALREFSYKQGQGIEIIAGLVDQIDGVMTICDGNPYTTEIRIAGGRIQEG